MNAISKITARPTLKPVFVDTAALPWCPHPLEGTWFKLLNIDSRTGGFTCLLRVEENSVAAIHKHIGTVEGYLVRGGFGYGDDAGDTGSFLFEEHGSLHEPTTEGGFELFVITRGTTIGYNDSGAPVALLDASLLYQIAAAHNAADHLAEFAPLYEGTRIGMFPALANVTEDRLVHSSLSSLKARIPARRAFLDTTAIPWSDWIMEGTEFKLLNVNLETGGWSMLLRVRANQKADLHHHVGAIEGIILEGEFGYGEHDRGSVGAYVYEPAEAVHEPTTTAGFTMFAHFHGPVAGYHPDGSLAALADQDAMLELARANGALAHLEPYLPDYLR
jgi:2,4'-dihydroxyacetophenone dioxygenase